MTTFITGGTGNTGFALAKLLQNAHRPVVIASRSGEAPKPFNAVKFNWFEPNTYESALSDSSIDRIYLLGPSGSIESSVVTSFIDFAIAKGIKRYVLLSATTFKPQSSSAILASVVHQYLLDKKVDYAVIRPTTFMQNFGSFFVPGIKYHNQFFSATQDGRIPWVSTEDVAQAAFEALTADVSPNKDIFVVGPDLYSYADVARMLSDLLGRPIVYKRLTIEEQTAFYAKVGLHPDLAKALAGNQKGIQEGSEEAIFNDPKLAEEGRKFTGSHTLKQYLQDNIKLWSN